MGDGMQWEAERARPHGPSQPAREGSAVVVSVPASVAYSNVSLVGRAGAFLTWNAPARRRSHE